MESKKTLAGHQNRSPKQDTETGHQQIYVSDYQLSLNLRSRANPHAPTIIYAVVSGNGTKHRLNSGVKVYPSQWNKRKQMAVESNELTPLDNRNNAIANARLKEVRDRYALAVDRVQQKPDEVREIVAIFAELLGVKTMGKKVRKQTPFTAVLSQTNRNDTRVRESTRNLREQAIGVWKGFLKVHKLEDLPETVNRKNWLEFIAYLENAKRKDGKTNKYKQQTIFQDLSTLKALFRLYNGNQTDDGAYCIPLDNLKNYEKVKLTEEQAQSNYVVFNEDAIAALYKRKLPKEQQQTAKDLFLFQCCIGCRVSDLKKIVAGDYGEQEIDGNIYINYTSKKTDRQAFVRIDTPTAKALYEWVKTLKVFPFPSDQRYDYHIKHAFRELGYTETHKAWGVRGGKKVSEEKPLWDVVTSHDARHSFITNMYYRGFSADDIKLMSGHKDTKMIDEIYKKLDVGNEFVRFHEIAQKHPPIVEMGTDFGYDEILQSIEAVEAMEAVKKSKTIDTDIALAEVKALSKCKGGNKE